LALYLDFEDAKNDHVLRVLIWGFVGCKRSFLGFDILILIWIWSLVSVRSLFQILAPYLDFEGAKNIHVLKILNWGFGGCWRFLTWVWHLDHNLDMVTGL